MKGISGIRHPNKGLEILGPAQTDGGPVHVVAPHDVIGILDLHEPRIIAVADGIGLAFFVDPLDRVRADLPFKAVRALAKKQGRPSVFLVRPEDPDKLAFMRQRPHY